MLMEEVLPPPQRVKIGAYCTNPGLPHLANHNTLGWYLNGSIFNFNTPIYSDITLVANYQYVPYSHEMKGQGVMHMWRYSSSGSVKRRYYRVNGTFPLHLYLYQLAYMLLILTLEDLVI